MHHPAKSSEQNILSFSKKHPKKRQSAETCHEDSAQRKYPEKEVRKGRYHFFG